MGCQYHSPRRQAQAHSVQVAHITADFAGPETGLFEFHLRKNNFLGDQAEMVTSSYAFHSVTVASSPALLFSGVEPVGRGGSSAAFASDWQWRTAEPETATALHNSPYTPSAWHCQPMSSSNMRSKPGCTVVALEADFVEKLVKSARSGIVQVSRRKRRSRGVLVAAASMDVATSDQAVIVTLLSLMSLPAVSLYGLAGEVQARRRSVTAKMGLYLCLLLVGESAL